MSGTYQLDETATAETVFPELDAQLDAADEAAPAGPAQTVDPWMDQVDVSPSDTRHAWGLGSADDAHVDPEPDSAQAEIADFQDLESFAASAPQSETPPATPSDESIESSGETSGPSRVADVLWHLTVFDVQLAHLKRQFDNSERSYVAPQGSWTVV